MTLCGLQSLKYFLSDSLQKILVTSALGLGLSFPSVQVFESQINKGVLREVSLPCLGWAGTSVSPNTYDLHFLLSTFFFLFSFLWQLNSIIGFMEFHLCQLSSALG